MKVVIIANKFEIGGAPRSMYEMISNLKNNYGVDLHVFVRQEGKLAKLCAEAGINYYVTGHEPFAIGKGSSKIRRFAKLILRPYYKFKCINSNKKAIDVAKKNMDFSTVDLIHTNSNRDVFGAMLSKEYNIPHVWHLREFGKEDYDCVFLLKNSIEFMNKYTAKFVCISEAVKNAWQKKGLDDKKLVHIYNGIDMSKMKSDINRKSFESENIKAVFVGTVCPAKGQIEVIEGLAHLTQEEKCRVKVDFYGEGPIEYINFLKDKANKNGVNVEFKGFCDKIGDVLQNYNFAMVCSRAEAFGRITPEYMSAGLIVLASDTGANPELIDDEKTGFLYNYGNSKDFANKIKNILYMDKNSKIEMSMLAENVARNTYTAEKNAENVYHLYEDIKRGNL